MNELETENPSQFCQKLIWPGKPVTFQTGPQPQNVMGFLKNPSQLNKENENLSNFPAHPQLQKVMGFSKTYGIVMGF